MAKKVSSVSSLPGITEIKSVDASSDLELEDASDKPVLEGEVQYVTIKIPVVTGRHVGGYRTNAIQAKRLRVHERNAVHDILEGLKEVGAVLRDGKQVSDHCDVVRYILGLADEQIGGQ